MTTSETQTPDTPDRPFGYWLKAVDRLMAAEFAAAFESEGVTRGDWRLLNAIDGTVATEERLPRPRLRRLADRGWIVRDDDDWTLTDEGRAAKSRLGALVDGIRAKVTDAVSPDDLATTLASLADIARAFGWDEETPLPRRHGRRDGDRRGFGPRGFGRDFGRGGDWRRALRFAHLDRESLGHGEEGHAHGHHGHGPERGCRDEHPRHGGHGRHSETDHRGSHGERGRHGHGDSHSHGHGRGGSHGHDHHGEHRHSGPHRAARLAQHAYERGFDAGFTHGRDA